MLKLKLADITLPINGKGDLTLGGAVRLYSPIKVTLKGRSCPLGKEEDFNPINSMWVGQIARKLRDQYNKGKIIGVSREAESRAFMDAIALLRANAAAIDSYYRDLLNPPTPQPALAKPRFNGGLSGTAIAVRTPPKVRYF